MKRLYFIFGIIHASDKNLRMILMIDIQISSILKRCKMKIPANQAC